MVSLALVLAILAAIGPVLELDAAGLQVMAPLIQQHLKQRIAERTKHPKQAFVARPHERSCVQFRCSE